MLHHASILLESAWVGLAGHMSGWEGWAVVVAGLLFGWRGAGVWAPLVAALVINPIPYGIVFALLHGRISGLAGAATFTAYQIVLCYAGFVAARLVRRFR